MDYSIIWRWSSSIHLIKYSNNLLVFWIVPTYNITPFFLCLLYEIFKIKFMETLNYIYWIYFDLLNWVFDKDNRIEIRCNWCFSCFLYFTLQLIFDFIWVFLVFSSFRTLISVFVNQLFLILLYLYIQYISLKSNKFNYSLLIYTIFTF